MENSITHIWPIGGGKGGSGKSFFTGSLGFLLAKRGYRTLLVDVDLGAANLHTIVGVPHPEKSISDFISKRVGTLEETVVPTFLPNLYLISGAMNNLDIANLAHEQKMKILRNVAKLSYDYILLDLGAGTSFNTIDFFMISNAGIFVTTPEPTSIENIYRLIRSVYFRKIHQVLKTHNFKSLAGEAEKRNPMATVNNPDLLLHVMNELDPEKSALLEHALGAFHFKLALNQLRKQDNQNTGALICKIIEKHLTLKINHIGNVSFDDRVHSAVCKKMPFMELYPYTQTTLDLRECCRMLLSAEEAASPALQNVVD
ncbi:MAG: AAA family ATPase [Deltaproteobacteria bacterium]|nr:AAA family ATPase [Deltaproteobacteria bacterium]